MANFQWQFDTPTGVWKEHAVASDIFQAAIEDMKFMEHVRVFGAFGRRMGESITFPRVAAVAEPTSVSLTEGERIPEDEFVITTNSVTVGEKGRAIPFTSFADDLNEFDLQNPIQAELRRQMGLAMDTLAATAFKLAKVKYQPTGPAAGTFTTNGTFAGAATANWSVYHIEEIYDYMYDTLQVPPAVDGDYIAIVRNLGLRGIKRDPNWEEWKKYTDPQSKFNGEVGRMEQIRFIGTNHNNALGQVGTSSVLGEGVVFGQDSVAMAEVQSPELRAETNVGDDFGRQHAVAWYAINGFNIIWDTGNAGQARIVHVGST